MISFGAHSAANLLLPILEKNSKKPTFFQQKPKFRTHLRNLTISVSFFGKFSVFSKFKNFLVLLRRKKTVLRTNSFYTHSIGNLPLLPILKKIKLVFSFLEEPILFPKKPELHT